MGFVFSCLGVGFWAVVGVGLGTLFGGWDFPTAVFYAVLNRPGVQVREILGPLRSKIGSVLAALRSCLLLSLLVFRGYGRYFCDHGS